MSLDTSSNTKEEGQLPAPANSTDLATSTAPTSSQATSSASGSYPYKPKEPEVPKTAKKADTDSSTTSSSSSNNKDYQPPTSTQRTAQYTTSSSAVTSNDERSSSGRYFDVDNLTLGCLEVFQQVIYYTDTKKGSYSYQFRALKQPFYYSYQNPKYIVGFEPLKQQVIDQVFVNYPVNVEKIDDSKFKSYEFKNN